ncbi:anti-sigma factor family protein [Phreatobacter sp. AB_2022a]|uniref:anti-sigma factor family protein n=1 Tax=Phreatobacter sp. AB_2022a TaxID=3003134 RepID=UPI0022875481|nr:anti-sigma factor [Phreatobacter sp. AB_2022a]MCZ0735140.1 anti-sigma factor [Phreatobacter sp. AB_2022a]
MTEGTQLPSDPMDLRLLLHALVDGELDAATTLALERRLAGDPALAAEHVRIAAQQAAIRSLPRPAVSDAFRTRVAALAGRPDAVVQRRLPHPAPFGWRAMAASILVTAVLASGLTQWAVTRDAPDGLVAAIASGHRRSLLAASPVDVASSDRHTVKPWLDARIGLSPAAPDLARDGFSLLGGRVEVIGDKPVPALVYRHREHLVTLVAAPQGNGTASMPAGTPRSTGGFSLIRWADGAFLYWAVSDTDRATLEDFVRRFRAAAAG